MHGIGQAIKSFMIIVAILGGIVGGIIIYAIPYVWSFIKPWLHQITA